VIDPQTLALFAIASFALVATPGPDMLLIAARSAAQGRTAGLMTYLGVAAGSFCHAAALALGLSQLFLAVPFAYDAVRYAGAAYLVYLAWQAFTSPSTDLTATNKPKAIAKIVMFRQGFLSNILNPKTALFFLALFPQFIEPANGSVALQIMILATVLNVLGLCVNGTVAMLAGSMKSLSGRTQAFAKYSRYFLGTVFGGLAAKLVFDGQR
jgi:threonine/homoserine/homoserine lactone efflux protein